VRDSLTQIRELAPPSARPSLAAVFPHHGQMQPGILDRTYRDPLVALTREVGLVTVDLLPAFRASAARGENAFIPFDGHRTSWASASLARPWRSR